MASISQQVLPNEGGKVSGAKQLSGVDASEARRRKNTKISWGVNLQNAKLGILGINNPLNTKDSGL